LPKASGKAATGTIIEAEDTGPAAAPDDVVEIDIAPVEQKPKQAAPAATVKKAETTEAKTTKKADAPQKVAVNEKIEGGEKPADREKRPEAEVVPFSRPPDDPGVDPDEETDDSKSRFRLF
jgi:uncharacterized membrane-anchored protein